MALAILDKLNPQRHNAMPVYQHLAEQIITRINSGKLNPGDKLPTEHNLANQLGINRLTVRKSYQVLEHKNLVERRRSMGTFLLDAQKNTSSVKRRDNTIYILILQGTSFGGVYYPRRCHGNPIQGFNKNGVIFEIIKYIK